MKIPKTITNTIYVVVSPYTGNVSFNHVKLDIDGWATVAEKEVTVEIPDVDPTPEIVAGLRAKQAGVYAEAEKDAKQIEEQIQKFLALPAPEQKEMELDNE